MPHSWQISRTSRPVSVAAPPHNTIRRALMNSVGDMCRTCGSGSTQVFLGKAGEGQTARPSSIKFSGFHFPDEYGAGPAEGLASPAGKGRDRTGYRKRAVRMTGTAFCRRPAPDLPI